MWLESLLRSMQQVESRFLSGYPDIVLPILTGLTSMRHGIRILVDESSRRTAIAQSTFAYPKLETFVRNLVRFPTIGPRQESLLSLVSLCTSTDSRKLLSIGIKTEDAFLTLREQFRLTMAGLQEFRNYVALSGNLTKDLWAKLNGLLKQIVLIWKQQQKELENREAEKDSLYKNKARLQGDSLAEDEEIARELKQLFPTHRDEDFADVDEAAAPSLERRASVESRDEDFGALITEDHMKEVRVVIFNS